jgi:hypothetical protein
MSVDFPPSAYTDWVLWTDAVAAGSDELPETALAPLEESRLSVYGARRAIERYTTALNTRIMAWQSRLLGDITALAHGRGESIGPLLIDARSRLGRLRTVADYALLPVDVRKRNLATLEEFVAETQRQLEEALRDRKDGGRMLAEARGTPLTTRPAIQPDAAASAAVEDADADADADAEAEADGSADAAAVG